MSGARQATKPGRTSFHRSARLLNPTDFKRVFSKSVASTDRFFKVLGRPNDSGCSRLGMAVSRQVDKRAVGRNRIKRVIRESFRHSLPRQEELGIGTAHKGESNSLYTAVDLVVLPRRECASICNRQLFRSLDKHWIRISEVLEQRKETPEQNTPRAGELRPKQDAGTI